MDEYANIEGAPDWYTAWANDVHSRGGVVTRDPSGGFLNWNKGQLAGRFPAPDGSVYYELAPLSVRIHDAGEVLNSWLDVQPVVQVIETMGDTVNSSPADLANAAADLANKGKSLIPWWAYGVVAVVGYGALVQVGIVPPLNKLFGKSHG